MSKIQWYVSAFCVAVLVAQGVGATLIYAQEAGDAGNAESGIVLDPTSLETAPLPSILTPVSSGTYAELLTPTDTTIATIGQPLQVRWNPEPGVFGDVTLVVRYRAKSLTQVFATTTVPYSSGSATISTSGCTPTGTNSPQCNTLHLIVSRGLPASKIFYVDAEFNRFGVKRQLQRKEFAFAWPDGAQAYCWGHGGKVDHGTSKTYYAMSSPSVGASCSSLALVRTCTNGILGGDRTYRFATCIESNAIPETPTALPRPGASTVVPGREVSLQSTNATSIRFTIDGTEPTCSVGVLYGPSSRPRISNGLTVKAVGCNGSSSSSVTSFTYLVNPLNAVQKVSVQATDSSASETKVDTGTILFKRSGPTENPLTVKFSLGGTAAANDYSVSPSGSSITIPAGALTQTLLVTPTQDTAQEGQETVVVRLVETGEYVVSEEKEAAVTISDTDAGTPASARAVSTPDGTLRIQLSEAGGISAIRLGDTVLPKTSALGGFSFREATGRALQVDEIIDYGTGTYTVSSKTGGSGMGAPITVEQKYTTRNSTVNVDVTVSGTNDLPLTITYTLPVDGAGWTWHDTLRASRVMYPGSNYRYWGTGSSEWQSAVTSVYPFGTISNNVHALSVGIPMNVPRIYRIQHTPQGLQIAFDVGVSAAALDGKATFSFVIYRSEGRLGMRGALQKYYDLFPEFFVRRIPSEKEGIWSLGGLRTEYTADNKPDARWADDYGISVLNLTLTGVEPLINNTAKARLLWSNTLGTIASAYRQQWGYKLLVSSDMATYNPPLSSSDALRRITDLANSAGTDPRSVRLREEATAALASIARTPSGDLLYERYEPEGDYDPKKSNQRLFYQFYVNNDIPEWREEVEKLFLRTEEALAKNSPLRIDAYTTDSWSGISRWNTTIDYDRSHWRHASMPLTFRDEVKKVGASLALANYASLKEVSDRIHARGLVHAANTNAGERRALGWLGHDVLDYFGVETALTAVAELDKASHCTNLHSDSNRTCLDSYALWKRAVVGKKPISSANHGGDILSPARYEEHIKKHMFYGIYTGANEKVTGNMWLPEVRALYRKYTPVLRALAIGGWEPVTYAESSNSGVWVERFGSLNQGTMHLTLRNNTLSPQTTTIALLAQPNASYTSAPIVRNSITNATISAQKTTGGATFTVTLQPSDTMVLKISAPGTVSSIVSQLTSAASAVAEDVSITSLWKQLAELRERLLSLKPSTSAIENNAPEGVSAVGVSDPVTPPCVLLNRTLRLGMHGEDVRDLQIALTQEGFFKEEATGYFGARTQKALQEWQSSRGIVSEGDAVSTGFGITGPRTQAVLKKSCPSPGLFRSFEDRMFEVIE